MLEGTAAPSPAISHSITAGNANFLIIVSRGMRLRHLIHLSTLHNTSFYITASPIPLFISVSPSSVSRMPEAVSTFHNPATISEVIARLSGSVLKFFQPSRLDTRAEGKYITQLYVFILPPPSSFLFTPRATTENLNLTLQ